MVLPLKPFGNCLKLNLLLVATSRNCPRLLILLLMSSSVALSLLAAKTQIYSQEVAFNCHFFRSLLQDAPQTVLYYSALLLVFLVFFFGTDEILQFLPLRVHNPSWLRKRLV